MAKYYMKEENLTSIADSVRNIYSKTGELTCANMASDLNGAKTEVGEQSELIDKIARKFWDVDLDGYLNRTIETFNSNKITSIGGYAFQGCTSLTSINLPNATSIGGYAFYNCEALTTVDLPNATSIGNYVFYKCTSLTSVDLPSATSIRNSAFRYCDSLTSLIIRTNSLCTLSYTNALTNTPIASGTGYIYVPKALIEDYKVATNWSTYASQFRAIEDYPDICGQEVTE